MKNTFFSFLLILSFFNLSAQFEPIQREDNYQVFLDLTEVNNDKLPVQIVTPLTGEDSVEFHMPRIIPGTYQVNDYGRFVTDFVALNGLGDTLETERIDDNRWKVFQASSLYKIKYTVDDTYDTDEPSGIFEPAGTSLTDSAFLLNNFGFVGYLETYKNTPFELQIRKPSGFYGSTSLRGEIGDTLDIYELEDYFTLHDSPLLYTIPDTAVKMVGGAEILVSVYSPNNIVTAAKCMEEISRVLDATAEYLGGKLPVDKYAVLIYTVSFDEAAGSFGALEHHTSTVLYMPEFGAEEFYSGVRDITAHEFFHIVTPLRIHSEMIEDFDFIDPEMSRHIWFYEGVTEYNSHLVQVRHGMYNIDEYMAVIEAEFDASDNYNEDIPLTVASRHTHTFMHDQYHNFYQKGALAGMALDLKLIELSDGEYRLVDLLKELGEVYGPDTFFVDDRFFDIITEMTYPEMRKFFALHFEAAVPFPFADLLDSVGITYLPEVEMERISMGNVSFDFNVETGRIKVSSIAGMDEFGKDLGWEVGDELVELNGYPMDRENISESISKFYENTQEGDKVKVVVERPKGEDDFKTKKLRARARSITYIEQNILIPMDDPNQEQLRLRKVWINQ